MRDNWFCEELYIEKLILVYFFSKIHSLCFLKGWSQEIVYKVLWSDISDSFVRCCFALKGQCHKIFCFRFFSWIIFPQASKNTKICRLFYICGPSACVAICGFAICRPNIFCNLQILRSADPNLLRTCNFRKSANSLLFCLQIIT
jgi:hypothetical protein